jgi:hypothetical protein
METPLEPISDAGEPTCHYDTVVAGWKYLLGEDLHYGYFQTGTETLTDATDALTDEMLRLAGMGQALSQPLPIRDDTEPDPCF